MLDHSRPIECTTPLEVELLATVIELRREVSRLKSQPKPKPKKPEPKSAKVEPPLQPPAAPAVCVLDESADRVCAGNATMKQIQIAICDRFNITLHELRSQRRQAYLLKARQSACMLIRALTSKSFPEIGKTFGNKDHSTILHAARKMAPVYERLAETLTPEDTLATWVRHTYNMVMRDAVPLARPKAPKNKPVDFGDNHSGPVLDIAAERASFAQEPSDVG